MAKKGISYYKKDLAVKENDQELLLKYNMLLEKASEEDTILLLNARILEKMVEV